MNDIEEFKFDLDDPFSYQCIVYAYLAGHQRLVVRVDRQGDFGGADTFYLLFAATLYFSGPTTWYGANFEMGDHDEFMHRLRSTMNAHRISRDQETLSRYQDNYRLFVVRNPGTDVEILAHGVVDRYRDIIPYLSSTEAKFRRGL